MEMSNIPFGTTDWSAVEPTVHRGETGTATWGTQTFNGIRVRIVEYSPGYLAITGAPRAIFCWFWRASCTPSSPTAAR